MGTIFSKDKDGQFKIKTEAFASKTVLHDGAEKSLYKRIHGKKFNVAGDGAVTNMDFTIPWIYCKVEAIEIINAEIDDCLTFEVLDKAVNPVYGVPNLTLNTFGFDVFMDASGYYEQRSQYDADLIKDFQLRIKFTNNNVAAKDIYINYILNEVK